MHKILQTKLIAGAVPARCVIRIHVVLARVETRGHQARQSHARAPQDRVPSIEGTNKADPELCNYRTQQKVQPIRVSTAPDKHVQWAACSGKASLHHVLSATY